MNIWIRTSTERRVFTKINHTNSAIHKAGGFMVHSSSAGLSGIIPVEQKSVHWLSMGAAGRNDLQRSFCMAAGCTAAL